MLPHVRTPLGQISVEVWLTRAPRNPRIDSTHHEANNTIIELHLDKQEVGDDAAYTVQTVVVMRAAFLRA